LGANNHDVHFTEATTGTNLRSSVLTH